MIRIAISTLAVLLFTTSAHPQRVLTPKDFAYGMELRPERGASIYQVEIPTEVYETIARDDLGDLRVFDSSGQPVPQTLRWSTDEQIVAGADLELPFFPLRYEAEGSGPVAVEVRRDSGGTVVSVSESPSRSASVSSWLIDTSALETLPSEIEIFLEESARNFVAKIDVSASEDLVSWSRIVASAPLARLSFRGDVIENRVIELPDRQSAYLRLDWPREVRGTAITRIVARLRTARIAERRWSALSPRLSEGGLVYPSTTRAPIDRLGLTLPRNALVSVTISSRRGDGEWRTRYEGDLYKVSSGEDEIAREVVSISPTLADEWRLELREGALPTPELRVGWVPGILFFLAQGEAPYTLAWGSAAVQRPESNGVEQLLERIGDDRSMISSAVPGPRSTLGGEARLRESPRFDRFILWGVLVLGVIAVGFLAWRLWREMSSQKATED